MNNPTGSTTHRLLAEILTRYGTIDAFCARLHAALDSPTDVFPAATESGGRHRLGEPVGGGAARCAA
ncbi:hypothetical protein [Nocardia niigatensis]